MARQTMYGRRVMAALVTSTLAFSTVQAVLPPLAVAENTTTVMGKEGVVSASGHIPWHGVNVGTGTITIDKTTVKPGERITLVAKGLVPRGEYGVINIGLEDGEIPFPEDKDQKPVEYDFSHVYKLEGENKYDADNGFKVSVKVPEDIIPGWSFISVYDYDNAEPLSKQVWFKVEPGPKSPNVKKPPAEGVQYYVTASGTHPKPEVGKGALEVSPEPGQELEVGRFVNANGGDFVGRGDDGFIAYKIEDGKYPFTTAAGSTGEMNDTTKYPLELKNGALIARGDNGPDYDYGGVAARFKLPENIPAGWTFLTVLGGADGKEKLHRTYWFKVKSPIAPPVREAKGTTTDAWVSSWDHGITYVEVEARGFDPGAEVTATIDGKPASWYSEDGKPTATITADEKGGIDKETLQLDPGVIPAGKHTVVLTSGDLKATFDAEVEPAISATPQGGRHDLALGSTVDVMALGLPEGATVDAVTVHGTNLLAAPVKSTRGEFTGRDGKKATSWVATATGIAIPNDEKLLGHHLRVSYTLNGTSHTEKLGRIAPASPLVNEDAFTVTSAPTKTGNYQIAYSAKKNLLYVARTDWDGDSTIAAYDPKTLKVVKESAPLTKTAAGDARAFGIAVDDAHDRVWVTNTGGDSVSVYKADDLSLVKAFPKGVVKHPRAVVVDEKTGTAYVSEPTTRGKETIERFTEDKQLAPLATPGFTGPMNMEINQDTGVLTASSHGTPKIMTIDVRKAGATPTIFTHKSTLKGGSAAVSTDPASGTIFVAGYDNNTVVALDGKTGDVKWSTPTGQDVLDVQYDAIHKLVYGLNREAGTLTVLDPATGSIKANLAVGTFPNHMTIAADGTIYLVDKAKEGDPKHDHIFAIAPKEKNSTPTPPPSSSPSTSLSPSPNPPTTETTAPNSAGPINVNSSATGSSNSKQQGSSAAFPILAILGALAAVSGAAWYAVTHGMVPASALPPQLRAILHL